MQTKDYSITLDMLRTLPFRPFEIVEGDTGNILHVTLLNNGDAMDLTNCKLCITFASSSGFAMQDETSGVEKTEAIGTFDIALLPAAYGAGNVSADIQVYSGEDDTTLITSTRFDFRCRKSLISSDIIHANEAYPPLVEATRIANEAAATALAAAARIDTDIGELNVQANWTESDDTSDAFIKNKPAIPSAPGDVGAASAAHAIQHASGGADAVSPASIGAATTANYTVSVPVTGWNGSAPYTQTISVSGILSTDVLLIDVVLSSETATAIAELEAYAYLSKAESGANQITLTCLEDVPEIDFTLRLKAVR